MGWYNPYGFTARKVKPSEHNPKKDMYKGEVNVCCPKCGCMEIGMPSKNKMSCLKCGFVGTKKSKGRVK